MTQSSLTCLLAFAVKLRPRSTRSRRGGRTVLRSGNKGNSTPKVYIVFWELILRPGVRLFLPGRPRPPLCPGLCSGCLPPGLVPWAGTCTPREVRWHLFHSSWHVPYSLNMLPPGVHVHSLDHKRGPWRAPLPCVVRLPGAVLVEKGVPIRFLTLILSPPLGVDPIQR